MVCDAHCVWFTVWFQIRANSWVSNSLSLNINLFWCFSINRCFFTAEESLPSRLFILCNDVWLWMKEIFSQPLRQGSALLAGVSELPSRAGENNWAVMSPYSAIRAKSHFLAINQLTISSNPVPPAWSSGCSRGWVPSSRCPGRYMRHKLFCWHVVPNSLHKEQIREWR